MRGRLAVVSVLGLTITAISLVSSMAAGAQPENGAGLPAQNSRDDRHAGSASCQRCHRGAYEQWDRSIHVRMIRPAESTTAAGDFDHRIAIQGEESLGRPDPQVGRIRYGVSSAGERRFVSVAHANGMAERFEVHYTLGAKRFEGYLSRLGDGRIYVLPLFWHVEWRRWLDWSEITPVADQTEDSRQIWNINCFNCHATNIQRNFDVRTRTFATTWAAEPGVGCEACHGPGREHVARMEAWGKDPSSYPDIDPSRTDIDLSGPLAIFVPRTSSARQVFDSCSYCHGNKTNYFTGFRAGDRLDDYAQLALASDPIPAHDPQGEFWPDGRPSRFNRPQALTLSGCFIKGQVTCTNCHAAHGSTNEHSLKVPLEQSNALCTQCHQSLDARTPTPARRAPIAWDAADLSRHTHHPATSPGSRCVECHMSNVNWRLLNRRRDHTFVAPIPEITSRYGVPNACTTCHEDRTPEWAATTMNTWYGDGARRQEGLQVADAMYAAGSGDLGSLPGLAKIAVDRSQGALLRASAAGFLGRLLPLSEKGATPRPEAVSGLNVLIGAASDPEPMVRSAAVRSLGQADPAAATSALVARLTDPSRVVRIAAAEALLYAGVTRLRGPAGLALARSHEDYAASLRTFGDVASHYTSLGWLRAEQGRPPEARRELEQAIRIDPRDPRPHMYLGVLAARAEAFEQAVAHWRRARQLKPDFPNINQLIEAASARRQSR